MHAILLHEPGPSENLYWGEVPTVEPGEGEVRIRVAAAGINRADLLQRQGHYPPPPGVTDIIGLEAAGVIDAVGPGVTKWAVGQEVVALFSGGGYAEYVAVPEGQCAALPSGVSLGGAAAVFEVAATVVSNFDQVNLVAGETVLIHGGAGGIGSFAIPYAVSLGCRVVTTVGSDTKADYARGLGAELAVDYHGDWEVDIKAATGGVDVILDIIGAKYLEANVRLLKRNGRMVTIGLQGGVKGTLNIGLLLNKAATLTATSLRYRPGVEKACIVDEVVSRVWPLLESGAIPLPPITYFPMSEAAKAHAYLESGANVGKIVLMAE